MTESAWTELELTRALLLDADWMNQNRHGRESMSQALGRAALDASFEALRVPSARGPGGESGDLRRASRPAESGDCIRIAGLGFLTLQPLSLDHVGGRRHAPATVHEKIPEMIH